MISGKCHKAEDIFEAFPQKRQELENYIDSLDISANISRNRSFLIGCLHKAQQIFGYLPMEVQKLIACRLRIQLADVHGVISFYSYFTDKPIGTYKINVCTGTACFVKGADRILEEFKIQLGVDHGETTPDGKFTITSLRCIGTCSMAPVVTINDKVYAHVTPQQVSQIIADFN